MPVTDRTNAERQRRWRQRNALRNGTVAEPNIEFENDEGEDPFVSAMEGTAEIDPPPGEGNSVSTQETFEVGQRVSWRGYVFEVTGVDGDTISIRRRHSFHWHTYRVQRDELREVP